MAPDIVRKRPKKSEFADPTTVRLTKAMLKEIDAVAAKAGASRNEAILDLLEYALDVQHGRKPSESLPVT